MSIRKMAEVWDLELPYGPKLVLLSLADQANDAGICWPSVATIARRCGYSERGIRYVLDDLERQGLLQRQQRPGRAAVFTVTPATIAGVGEKTPAMVAGVDGSDPCNGCSPPLQPLQGTPAMVAGDPCNGCTQNPKETKENPKGTRDARAGARPIGMPDGVNLEALDLWDRWLTSRGKAAMNDLSRPLTASKLVAFGDAARQLEVVQHSIQRQWLSLHPPRPEDVEAAAKPRRRAKSADELEAEARARGEDPYAVH